MLFGGFMVQCHAVKLDVGPLVTMWTSTIAKLSMYFCVNAKLKPAAECVCKQ